NAILQFVLVALAVFFLVKGLNALHLREEEKKPAHKADPNTALLEEIRDLLKSKR
ncbi:MAG: MscL family protein, partial [Flavobacteriia bacterium]|nr:MscL family protein [Flavobacteriia bacterium]